MTSLQAYIMFEVVEAAWNAFMERLRMTQDLDGLIRAFLCMAAPLLGQRVSGARE